MFYCGHLEANIPLEVTLNCTAAECGKSLGLATISEADRVCYLLNLTLDKI